MFQILLRLEENALLQLHCFFHPGFWRDAVVGEALLRFLESLVALADGQILRVHLVRWVAEEVRVLALQILEQLRILLVGVINLIQVERLVVPPTMCGFDGASLAAQQLFV